MEFARISEMAPSFAGYYFDETGTLILQVRDSADFGLARAGASQMVTKRTLAVDARWRGNITIRPAKYTFYQLASWRDVVFNAWGRYNDIVSLDMDEVQNRVVIGIEPARLEALRPELLSFLASSAVDTAAVRLIPEARPPRSVRRLVMESTNGQLTGHADTVVAGVMIETPDYAATIAAVLDYGGVRSVLTCSHCTHVEYGPDAANDTLKQGGVKFGYEIADPAPNTCGTFPTFPCKNADAAIVRLVGTDTSEKGLIARPEPRLAGRSCGIRPIRTSSCSR
jgi:hypothetical protein